MSLGSLQNARAIEGALQVLQGPAATGKLLIKATGPDTLLQRGSCLAPIDGGQIERRGSVFVRTNAATATAKCDQGAWTVTAAGTLVDVEAYQGGEHGNRAGGLPYLFDPPIPGIDPEAIADTPGITGGSWLDAHGALKQFSHLKALNREPGGDPDLVLDRAARRAAGGRAWRAPRAHGLGRHALQARLVSVPRDRSARRRAGPHHRG
jgi:hypothetical protein